MKVFKCTNCGKAILAFDENLGMEVSCPYCQVSLIVPESNDSDCLQIFSEGAPDCGLAMTLQELEASLVQGTVSGDDLAYYEGGWKPLNQIFQIPDNQNKTDEPTAPSRLPTELSQLPPLDGYQKLSIFGKNNGISSQSSPHAFSTKRILMIVAGVLLLLVLSEGGCRLVNMIQKRHSTLIIFNGGEEPMALASAQVIAPGDTYVMNGLLKGFLPKRETIKYSFQSSQDATKTWKSETVSLKPSETILLRLGTSKEISLFRKELLQNANVPEDILTQLSSELSSGQVPASASALFERVANQCKEAYKGTSQDHIFSSKDYDFRYVPVLASFPQAESNANPPLMLFVKFPQQVSLQDDVIIEFNSQGDVQKMNFKLKLTSLPINGQVVSVSSARFIIELNENNLLCISIQPGTKGKIHSQKTPVVIDYSAHKNMAGEWIQNASYTSK